MTAAASLVAAALATLRADAALAAALGGRIHDVAPRDPAFPHLVVDETTSRDRSGLDAPLEETKLALRVFSRAGRTEAAAIAERVEDLLLAEPPAPVGRRLALFRREASETRLLRDRLTAEAVVRFVALTEPA